MKQYEFYKHENGRDVAIYPLDVRDHKYGLLVKAMWVNVHYHELGCRAPFPLPDATNKGAPLIEDIVIRFADIKKWKHYNLDANDGILKVQN